VLEEIHERLAGVVIECLPWANFIARYDNPTTLFYLDPPYWGSETDYGSGVFGYADFVRIATRLARIAGKFILSVNDVPETREAFADFLADFLIEMVSTRYTIARGKWNDVTEIVVTGPRKEPVPVPQVLLSL
jgi:DNA adenine methylase